MRFVSVFGASVAALAFSAAAAQACPDFGQLPAFGEVELGGMFEPYTVDLLAGGGIDITTCGIAADDTPVGWFAAAPDFNFIFNGTGGGNLYIETIAGGDTVLLVNGPDGTWYFNDDGSADGNSVVAIFGAQPGLYNVWVGIFSQGDALPTTLVLSEDR